MRKEPGTERSPAAVHFPVFRNCFRGTLGSIFFSSRTAEATAAKDVIQIAQAAVLDGLQDPGLEALARLCGHGRALGNAARDLWQHARQRIGLSTDRFLTYCALPAPHGFHSCMWHGSHVW